MAFGKGKGSMLVAAILTTGGSAQATDPAHRPIRLVSEVEGTSVLIRVVGESDTSFAADYTLEVASGGAGNSNRTVQRGSVTLRPNTPVVLLSTRLGGNAAGGWRARLQVSSETLSYQMEGPQTQTGSSPTSRSEGD
jgi:hypothetical protein